MTNEEKELLIKDLSARLRYGVIMHHKNVNQDFNLVAVFNDGRIGVSTLKENTGLTPTSINECQPYLRLMSSMTADESIEMFKTIFPDLSATKFEIEDDRVRYYALDKDKHFSVIVVFFNKIYSLEQFDWLNKNGFDYRGLISKGLAIENSK